MTRRRLLAFGCAHCAGLFAARAAAQSTWTAPARLVRPGLDTEEGGLWALFDREETRVRRSAFVMRDGGLREYLTSIACKLGGDHCSDTRVYPVRTAMFNASMAPNGMMQVWSGLMLRVDNEAQLAAIIGHEMGHYLQRHSLSRLRDAKDRSAFATLLAPLGLIGLVGQLATLAGQFAYSRDHEREADRIGIVLMEAAGYDPREAHKVWGNLRAELAANPNRDAQNQGVLFATHPPSDERQAYLAELAGSRAGFVGTDEYARKIEPFLWGMLEDELKRAQYDESIALLTRLCETRPQRADLRYFRGEARRLRATGDDTAQAMADFEAACAMDPPPAPAHRAMAFVHRQLGRKADAAAAFRRYLDAAPQAPDAELILSFIEELKT